MTRVTTEPAKTATPSAQSLASGFDAASHAQWRALVDKALKGADFEKRLVARTADGLAIKPLYTREDAGPEAGLPGTAPFTRGTKPVPAGLGWDITTLVETGDATAANRLVLADLEGGANAVLVVVEGPGQPGAAIASAADWCTVLSGVYLDLATIEVSAGVAGVEAGRALLGALPAVTGTVGQRLLAVNLDPIGQFARHGGVGQPVAAAVGHAISLASTLKAAEPAARTMLCDGTIYHEAGAGEAQELAAVAATLLGYLRAFEAAGVAPAQALAHVNVHLAADADIFTTASKVRAARTLIGKIAQACGAGPAAAMVRIVAVTSQRMMARRDPWTNMLRTTVATAGAAIGGADAIVTLPFTHALGTADAFAQRIARNTQIVAQEESGLGRVLDPAGGSWYVERLTADLAKEAWGQLQEIEADGGILAALTSGLIQGRIAAVAAARAGAIATGRQELTGVSAYPLLGPDGVTVTPRRPAPALGFSPEIEALAPMRLAARFEALRDRADAAQTAPRVFLASLGTAAEHSARSTFVRNLLASGGIGVLGGEDYASVEALAEAFAASGAKLAVLASSDAVYARMAEPAALSLKAIGAGHLMLAGRPGQAEAGYRAAGIDRFIFAGQDAIATLRELHVVLDA